MEQIQVDANGTPQFPLERGKWIAYPATDWAEQPDEDPEYFEGEAFAKLMLGREMALRSEDDSTARDFESQIEDRLSQSQ